MSDADEAGPARPARPDPARSPPRDGSALREELRTRAHELGFARVGVARVEPLGREARALREWLAAGHHASMGWMADTADVRADPGAPGMLPGARSVVVLAAPYGRGDAPVGPSPGVVARYARGRDYHNVLSKRLRKLARPLRERGFAARIAVDTLPLLERAWAQRAGVGFVGKNSCLIVPGLGSHVFLAALVTDAALAPDRPAEPRCGECTRCLEGCPTGAFAAPRVLDARRCVSYLTIEHRGPIGDALKEGIGARIFGCDDCQDVCPFNATAPPPPDVTEPFRAHPRFEEADAAALLGMDEERFVRWARGSPLRRAGWRSMARNAAIVLGGAGDRRHLPLLERARDAHPSPGVRDACAWACARLRSRGDGG